MFLSILATICHFFDFHSRLGKVEEVAYYDSSKGIENIVPKLGKVFELPPGIRH